MINNNKFLQLINYDCDKAKAFDQVEIHLADDCNLNCQSCDHFSPISDKKFPNFEALSHDILRLAEITNGKINTICLLGGEPLLNRDISKYLPIVRNAFHNSNIKIITNGILLPKQDATFWKSVRENNIYIEITKYPIAFNYDDVELLLNAKHVNYGFFGSTKIKQKTSHRLQMDPDGTQNPEYNYKHCFHAGRCVQLYESKLYLCPCCAYSYKLNNAFKSNFEICKEDYLDIYNDIDLNDIEIFINKPIPFCRYCKVDDRTFKNLWATSNKNKEEWI